MIDYQLMMNLIAICWGVIAALFLGMSWYYLIYIVLSFKKVPQVPHSDKKAKFGILVPARYEHKVIQTLINSLEKQTYDKKLYDVWVIVESQDDPTVEIVKKYGFNYFVRDELTPERKTKGFAIQECVRHFKNSNILYDAYMVFDADNVVSPNYIETMNDLYQTGVQVGSGYRNFTNANKNWIAAGSAILFSYLNQFASRGRSFMFKKCNLFGTGYFVAREVIDDAGGWIFTGMTEDVQLTCYCFYHDVYMKYYPYCEFYDEQCTNFREMHHQHVRWVWGFFEKRKHLKHGGKIYNHNTKKKYSIALFEYNVSVIPLVLYCVVLIIFIILSWSFAIASIFFAPKFTFTVWMSGLGYFLILYATFAFIATIVIIRDNKHLKLTRGTIAASILTYFLVFGEFGIAFIDGLIHKEKRSSWKVIKHVGNEGK